MKYGFYDYLNMDEVKDEFFEPVRERKYEELKNKECVLTLDGNWRKLEDVLVGDKDVRDLIKNRNLHRLLGKEFLSDKVLASRRVLAKLGVRNFSVDDLLECLEKKEWVESETDEWLVKLYKYFCEKKLSSEQIERLKSLPILRLEYGSLTSVDEGTVFLPSKGTAKYGFEHEFGVLRRTLVKKGKSIRSFFGKWEKTLNRMMRLKIIFYLFTRVVSERKKILRY